MKKSLFKSIFCLILILLQVVPTPVRAAFDHFLSGARGKGMADSMVGVADDANALFYNPAGLTQLPEGEITASYGRLLSDLNDGSKLGSSHFGYRQPLRGGKLGTIGVGYYQFSADNLFTENMLMLGYGRVLRNRPGMDGVLSVGFNLKNLTREFEPDRYTENGINDNGVASGQRDALFGKNGYSKSALALDLAGFYRFGPQYRYTAGLMIANANEPDVSLAGDGDRVRRSTKLGLGYRPSRFNLFSAELRRTNRLEGSADVDAAFGVEHRFLFSQTGEFEVRGGYAEGARGFRTVTAGASYLFYKMELDYALTLPIGGLADNQETHRLGFTVRLGQKGTPAQTPDIAEGYSLISTFKRDTSVASGIIDRLDLAENLTPRQKGVLTQILLRKFAIAKADTEELKTRFGHLLREPEVEILDNAALKRYATIGVADEERSMIEEGFDRLIAGDTKAAMARWVLLKPETRERSLMKGLVLISLSETAAQAYRQGDLETCIPSVGRIVELLPNDKEIAKAYRDLLNQRSAAYENAYQEQKEAATAAPTPTATKANDMTPYEAMVQSYGVSLGYYLTRKVKGANTEELRNLLNQMKAVYGQFNIDLTVVDTELTNLPHEKPVVEEQPQKPVTPKTEPKAKSEPKPKPVKPVIEKQDTMDPLERAQLNAAWTFYKKAVEEGITDRERIQTLESILNRFGADGTDMVMRELAMLRKKVFGK